jgi:hypothetical protein
MQPIFTFPPPRRQLAEQLFHLETRKNCPNNRSHHRHPAQQIVDPSHFPFEPKNPLQQYKPGYAEPDGPIKESMLQGDKSTAYEVPASSIVVLRGKLNSDGK